YTSRFGKGNGKISPPARLTRRLLFLHLTNHAQPSICAHSRRRKRRTLLAVEPAHASETIAAPCLAAAAARASRKTSRRFGRAGTIADFDERRPGSGRASVAPASAERKYCGGACKKRYRGGGR